MTNRLRPTLLALLAIGSLVPSLPATAQDSGDDDPPPLEAPVETGDNEVVHSWALGPAGSEEDGEGGNRSQLSYVGDPGSVIEDAVTLYNFSNVGLTFDIYATDAFNGVDGEFDLLPGDEEPTGVGSWVDMGAEEVPVDAGTQVTIPITISIPEGARPGDHAGAILAANVAVTTGDDGEQFTLDRRTGPRLYIRVNGPLTPDLAIADVQTSYDPSIDPLGGSATVTYRVENRGNVRMDGDVQASVGGPFGLGRVTAPSREIADLLPGESITLEESFNDVPALGVAVTEIELEPSSDGGTTVAASTRRALTFAPPIAVLMVLLLVLFGLLAWRAYRRHMARDATDADVGADAEASREPEHLAT